MRIIIFGCDEGESLMLPTLVDREPGNAGRDEGEEQTKAVRSLGLGSIQTILEASIRELAS